MTQLKQHKVEALQDATRILAQEMSDPGHLPGNPNFSTMQELINYLDSAEIRAWPDKTLALTEEAHKAAAAIVVNAPTEEQVENFKEKLKRLHEDIRGDQKLHAALALSGSVITALNRLG